MAPDRGPGAAGRPARRGYAVHPYAFVLPTLLTVALIIGFPLLYAVFMSFTDMSIGTPGTWVGFDNFRYWLQSATYQRAAINTVVIVVVSIALKAVVGTALAAMLSRRFVGRRLVRTLLMLPWAVPAFVAFLVWKSLYLPLGGGINLLLSQLGFGGLRIDWLGTPNTAIVSVIIATVWHGFPFWLVSILAVMQTIPRELYEAVELDGANRWQAFWHVTLPGITGVLTMCALLSTIWTANTFENVWLLTGGGPADSTIIFPVLTFIALQTQRLGEAAAVPVSLVPVFLLFLWVTISRLEKHRQARG